MADRQSRTASALRLPSSNGSDRRAADLQMWHDGGECSSAKATQVRWRPEAFAPVNRTPSCPVIVSYEPAPTGVRVGAVLGCRRHQVCSGGAVEATGPSRMTLICAG